MAAKRKTDDSQQPVDISKLHVEYNLEKEPLRTGKTAPRSTWRQRIAMGLGARGYRSLAIVFWIVLILLAGYAIVTLSSGFFSGRRPHPDRQLRGFGINSPPVNSFRG